MPKRTNNFQKLVALIERALAPQGAKVTESATVPAGRRGKTREIDILVESDVGPYHMKIAVEAKDEGRKMDLAKFDAIVGKYRSKTGVKVNHVVVVSRRGFTPEVIDLADAENITLLRLDRAIGMDWGEQIPQKMVFAVEPHVAMFEFPDASDNAIRMLGPTARLICTCCGKDHGSPLQQAHSVMNEDFAEELRSSASRVSGTVCNRATFELPELVVLRADGREFNIRRFTAHYHATMARGNLKAEAYKRDEQVIHHLSGDFADKHIEFVVPQAPTPHQIAMKIEDVPPERRHNDESKSVSPPVLPRCDPPDVFAVVIDDVQKKLSEVDAVVEQSAVVHNYATGEDICAPLLVRGYLAGPARFRSVVLFSSDPEPPDVALVESAIKVATGTNLDRVVVVQNSPFSDEARELAAGNPRIGILGPLSDTDTLIEAIGPKVAIYYSMISSLAVNLMGPTTTKFTDSPYEATITLDQMALTPNNLHQLIAARLLHQTFLELTNDLAPKTRFAEVHFSIAVPLRRGLAISRKNGDTASLSWLQGESTIQAGLVVLDTLRVVERDGKKMFEFSYKGDRVVKALTGSLPRNLSWTYEGIRVDQPGDRLCVQFDWRNLPELSGGTQVTPMTESHELVNIKMNHGSAPLNVVALRYNHLLQQIEMRRQSVRRPA